MKKTLAEKIKELRLSLGMSQDEFAKSLGYKSRATINKIELGINEMKFSKLIELSERYSVDLNEFRDKKDKKNYNSQINSFMNFLKESPSQFHAIKNVINILSNKTNLECSNDDIKIGHSYIFKRDNFDGIALIAIDIGENIKENGYPINIIASHSDSPWYNIKSNDLITNEGIKLFDTSIYGAPVISSWLDRPLTIAGKIKVNDEERLIFLKDENFIIPSSCAHFRKFVDDTSFADQGHTLLGDLEHSSESITSYLSKKLGINKEDITDINLHFINKEKPMLWGENKEYLSSPRLDNLFSVYTSTSAFLKSHNKNAINVLYIADNEEIGSKTDCSAFSSYLKDTLEYVSSKLGFDLNSSIDKSFMISSDNAQGTHPHYSYLYNPDHKVFLNKGLAIKYSEKYSSTEETIEIFKKISMKAKTDVQLYLNREGIPGGGTLGKIVQFSLPVRSVDVGVPQLSMHSSYETIGSHDLTPVIKTFKWFYNNFTLDSINK